MYIGVDVGGMSIKAGLVSSDGILTHKKVIKTDVTKPGEGICLDIARLIEDLTKNNGYALKDIEGIGVGIPGSVYDEKGVVRYCCNINMINTPLVQILKDELAIENIKVSNDASCALLGEVKFGAAKGFNNVVLVTIGTGIGTGLYIDGKLFRGVQSAGGECGHTTIIVDGQECGCGKLGHFEAYASATALLRQVQDAADLHPESKLNELIARDGLSGFTIFQAMDLDDETAKQVYKQYIKYLGTGIVNLINVFYPEVILLGGGISREGEVLLEPLTQYIRDNVFGMKYNPPVEIKTATLFNDAGIIGAAALSME